MKNVSNLIVSYAPHIRTQRTTQMLMADVVIAMLPALIAGICFFGLPALIHVLVCVLSCILFETLWNRLLKKENTINNFSAVVTGVLIAFNMPAAAPYWMGIAGSAFAIIIVKMFFGGLGHNFVNPALAARAFMLACWPVHMTTFVSPGFTFNIVTDAVSGATPLGALKESG